MKDRPLINTLFGISISTAVILSTFIVGVNNKLTVDLNDIKNGDVYANSITRDKLADDVFNTVNLELDDGTSISAQLVKATIKDGAFTESLEFETEDGETYTAKVLNTTVNGDIISSIPDGSITEEKLSTIVVNKLNSSNTTVIEGNSGGASGEIPDGSIVTAKLANGAVTTEKLADGSVGTIKLLDASITSSKLVDGVILTQHLANSSITSFKIADNAITTSKLLDNIITSVKVQDNAITSPKIANNAVTSIKLADGSITTLKIVDGAITEGKIADGSVTAFKLSNNAVVTATIEDGAITEAKLANGSISLSKLSTAMCSDGEILQKNGGVWVCTTSGGGSGIQSVTAGSGIVNTGTGSDPILDANVDDITIEVVADVLQIKDGAITETKLADGSVATAKIVNGSVTNEKLALDSVTTEKIVDSSVTSEKIANGTITNDDISASASIAWSKLSKTGSSLADLTAKNFSDLDGRTANLLEISDIGGYFTSSEVEGALQEIASSTFTNGGNAFGSTASIGTTDENTLSIITNNTPAITILSNNNVGIGDTTPLSPFTVGSNDAFQVNNLGVVVSASGITSSGTITFSNLNTAGLVLNNASGVLSTAQTIGSTYITNNTLNFAQFSNSLLLDASTDISATGTNLLSITNSGTGLSFRVNDQSSDTTPFVVDASGNVGITTSTPESLFSVANVFQVNSAGNITEIGNAANSLGYTGGVLNLTSAGTLTFDDSILDAPLPLTTSDAAINIALRQSIVDAINDLYTLTTGGGGSTLWSLNTNTIYPTTTTRDLAFGGNDSTASLFFSATNELLTLTNTTSGVSFRVNDQASDTTPFIVDASGNVGAGTSTPGAKIHSQQTGATTATNYAGIFENLSTNVTTNGINKYGLQVISTGSFTGGAGAQTNNYGLFVNTVSGGDNNYAAVFQGGFVGIGVTDPDAMLEVNGHIKLAESGHQLRDFNHLNLISNTNGTLDIGNVNINTGLVFTIGASGTTTFKRGSTSDLFISGTGSISVGGTTATSLFNVGSSAQFQINSSGNIVAIGNAAHSISNTSGLTLDSASTGLNLQSDGTVNVNLAGGAGATGCTVNNATGDLTCSGTISGATGGSYWSRVGTTLSPATADDIMSLSTAATTGPAVYIASTGDIDTGNAAALDILSSNTSTSVAAAMITNAGTGMSLVVNDDGTTTDSSPFIIDASGNVGIGVSSVSGAKLQVSGGGIKLDNNQSLIWRNAANNADISALAVNASNNLIVQNVSAFQSNVTFQTDTINNRTTNMVVGTTTAHSLSFHSNNAARITILSGGNVGVGDTTPASLFTVGNADLFQINSSGNIVALGGAAHSISNASGLTISSAATGLNLQSDGSVDVNIAGGSGATGCTINNTTGDLTCSGTVSGSSGGSYWGRSGSTLSPASPNDVVALSQGGTGITTANFKNFSVATAGTFDTTAVGLTNYSAHFANTSTESAGSNALTNIGLYATASGADFNYAAIFENGNVGIGTTSPTGKFETVQSGAKTATNYAAILQNTSTNTTTNGIDKYGLQIISTGTYTGLAGTATTNYGLHVNVAGADTNYAAVFTGGNVGIGTSTPNQILDIVTNSSSASATGIAVTNTNSAGRTSIGVFNNSNLGGVFGTYGSTFSATAYRNNFVVGADRSLFLLSDGTTVTGGTNAISFVTGGYNNTAAIYIAGGNPGNVAVGGTTTTSLFNVGASAQFQINSSGNIVAVGGAAHSISNSSGALNIDSATTGAINIGTSANAKTLTVGNTTGATALVFNSGTGSITSNSSVTTQNGFIFNANALTSGNGLYVSSTSTTFSTGSLASIYWNPGSTRVSTGDIFSLDVGANGVVNNIFNVKNAGSTVFAVTQGQVKSNVPLQVASPGDVSIAYDIALTNGSASTIKSTSALYLQAGEIFNSSDLTFKTFNSGSIVLDSPGGIESLQAQAWNLATSTTALNIESGLLNFDTTNTRLGVGTSAPTALFSVGSSSEFQVNGSGAIAAATGFTSTGTITFTDIASCASGLQTDGSGTVSCLPSDASLKQNIVTLSNALDTVKGLRGVSYNWTSNTGLGSQQEFGLIAQEVEAIAPQLVFTMGNGFKGVKYSQLTGLLVNAIKEQQVQIETIQAQLGISNSGTTVLTEDNIVSYFNNNVIPSFTVKKIKINEQLIARSVKVIEDATFYGTADFNNEVRVRGKLSVGENSAGRAKVIANTQYIDVTFTSEYEAPPIVTVTPTGSSLALSSINYTVTNVTGSGFRIELSNSVLSDIEFNWLAVGIDSIAPVSYTEN